MKTPPVKLKHTMRIRIPETMAAGLARIAFAKSHERGLCVGISSVAREAIVAHLNEQERRHGLSS